MKKLEKWNIIGVRVRLLNINPRSYSHTSNTPVQVHYHEDSQHQHNKIWSLNNIIRRTDNTSAPTVPADSG